MVKNDGVILRLVTGKGLDDGGAGHWDEHHARAVARRHLEERADVSSVLAHQHVVMFDEGVPDGHHVGALLFEVVR